MTIGEVIAAIEANYPAVGSDTVDTIKFGNADNEVTGIVTTCSATVEVIRKTAELGYNFIITHEPTFYTHEDKTDYLEGDSVYEEKCRLLKENGITIWRDHDHMHVNDPDLIFSGVMQELGWEDYCVEYFEGGKAPLVYEIPRVTVKELCGHLKEKLGIQATRVIGNVGADISRVLFIGGGHVTFDETLTSLFIKHKADVLIAGELLDWTVASYIRDAAFLGKNKAAIHLGHFNSEEPGMKYYPVWLSKLLEEKIPVTFIASGDPYRYE